MLRESQLPIWMSVCTQGVQVLVGSHRCRAVVYWISVYVHAPSCREGWKPGVHVSSGALVQVLTGVHGSHVCCVRQSGLFP